MQATPKVSICIPAYRGPDRLQKALSSCFSQNYKDFEVVVSDDSPEGMLAEVIRKFSGDTRLKYFHNPKALGSPENWNRAVSLSTGKFIKILHHDDWFTDDGSLGKFVELIESKPGAGFAFCGSLNCDPHGKPEWVNRASELQIEGLRKSPEFLFLGNFIGAPSATIYRRTEAFGFDKKLKYLVDFEFYIQILKKNPIFAFSTEPLIAITTGALEQVTAVSAGNREVEVFEQVYVYNKLKRSFGLNAYCVNRLFEVFSAHGIRSASELIACGVDKNDIRYDLVICLFIRKVMVKSTRLSQKVKLAPSLGRFVDRALIKTCFLMMGVANMFSRT